jgi:hypothetical protein
MNAAVGHDAKSLPRSAPPWSRPWPRLVRGSPEAWRPDRARRCLLPHHGHWPRPRRCAAFCELLLNFLSKGRS